MFQLVFCPGGKTLQPSYWTPVKAHKRLHAPLKAKKCAGVLLSLTMILRVFQSIEREEPIEVDPTPTNTELENGHAATTGNHMCVIDKVFLNELLQ